MIEKSTWPSHATIAKSLPFNPNAHSIRTSEFFSHQSECGMTVHDGSLENAAKVRGTVILLPDALVVQGRSQA